MEATRNETPSADRIHIVFFGKRNAGKSSLVNADYQSNNVHRIPRKRNYHRPCPKGNGTAAIGGSCYH